MERKPCANAFSKTHVLTQVDSQIIDYQIFAKILSMQKPPNIDN
jgi:hypothetical protein